MLFLPNFPPQSPIPFSLCLSQQYQIGTTTRSIHLIK